MIQLNNIRKVFRTEEVETIALGGVTMKVNVGEFVAIIQEISLERRKIKALIDMFGRETLAELDFTQVEKLV